MNIDGSKQIEAAEQEAWPIDDGFEVMSPERFVPDIHQEEPTAMPTAMSSPRKRALSEIADGAAPFEEESRGLQQHNFSRSTVQALHDWQDAFMDRNKEWVPLQALTMQPNEKNANKSIMAATFFEVLVLASKGLVKVRQKSAFAGKLDLFFHCDLLLSYSTKTELHLLREVSIKTTFEQIRTNYLKTSAASYFVELIEEVTELDHPAPELYRLLLRALGYLDKKSPDSRGVFFFESELCKCLGLYAPNMHSAADKLVEAYGPLPKARGKLLGQM